MFSSVKVRKKSYFMVKTKTLYAVNNTDRTNKKLYFT